MLRKFFLSVLILVAFIALPVSAEEKEKTLTDEEKLMEYIYEPMEMQKMSQLYWALDVLDTENDTHIDNFLRINECDIYRDYYSNEFEWQSIREAGRAFVKENKESFPVRFEIMQPLKLRDYNFELQAFEVDKEFHIDGISRFEVLALDYAEPICTGASYSSKIENIEGYPRGVLISLNRPITVQKVLTSPEKAQAYIDETSAIFRNYPAHQQTRENLYDLRKAYLVMKVKFFADTGEIHWKDGVYFKDLFAVLEGIEIYTDISKENLLYAESYRRSKEDEAKRKKRKEKAKELRKEMKEADENSEGSESSTPAEPVPASEAQP